MDCRICNFAVEGETRMDVTAEGQGDLDGVEVESTICRYCWEWAEGIVADQLDDDEDLERAAVADD